MALNEAMERSYGGAASTKPALRDHWNGVQRELLETREILQSALNRMRGAAPPSPELAREKGLVEPEHIIFLGQQTLGLSSEVSNLARDLAEYI